VGDIDRKIARLVDRIEGGLDDPGVKSRLEERRSERRGLMKRIEELKRADDSRGPKPTERWVREQLQTLGESLKGDTPAAAYALRALVDGEIIVTEIRREGRKRFHLQGRFTIRVNSVRDAVAGYGCDVDGSESDADQRIEVIVIDFVDPNPLDAAANEAKSLYDQGLMNAKIARILGCSRSQVTKLLKHWFESRGLTMPDGRSRRSQLKQKHLEPPLYQRISEDVKVLCDEGLLFEEIAERMQCHIATVKAALCYWYESRGMTAPDGRSRRKSLDRKVSKPRRSKVDDLPDGIEAA
jgi:transposase